MTIACLTASIAAFWFQITPAAGAYDADRIVTTSEGEFVQEKIVFDMASASNLVSRFERDVSGGFVAWVDDEHASSSPGWTKSDALGFIDRMAVQADGSVMARIIFFRKGYEAVIARRFVGISPAFFSHRKLGSRTSRPNRIVAVALTTRPHIGSLTLNPRCVEIVPEPPDPRRS